MMKYLYLFFAVASSGISPACYKQVSTASSSKAASAFYPVLWLVPLAVVFGAYALIQGIWVSGLMVFDALLAALAVTMASFSLLESLKRGSYTVSIILVNLSFYIPIVLSLVFLKENAEILQIAGMLLLTLVIVLLNLKKGREKERNHSLLFALLACLGNGLMNFGVKLHEYHTGGKGAGTFFFLTYTFAAVMCLVLCLCLRRKGEEKFSFKGLYAPALGVGACIGICFFSMGRLSGMFPAVVQFTLVTTLSLLLGLTIGWIKYKEKITMKSVVSVICCLAAIALQCFNI